MFLKLSHLLYKISKKKSSSRLKCFWCNFPVKAVLDITHRLANTQTFYQNCLVGTARLACIQSQCYASVSQNSNFEIHDSLQFHHIAVAQCFQNTMSKGCYVRQDCVLQ